MLNQEVQKEKRANLELTEKYVKMVEAKEEDKNNIKELQAHYENLVRIFTF